METIKTIIISAVVSFLVAVLYMTTGGVEKAGSQIEDLHKYFEDGFTTEGTSVFNEAGQSDVDLRVEGDTESSLLFLDASTDRIGVATSSPSALFSVGDASATTTMDFGKVCIHGVDEGGTSRYAYFDSNGDLATTTTSCF